jgi:hypothetical protein
MALWCTPYRLRHIIVNIASFLALAEYVWEVKPRKQNTVSGHA